MGLYYTPNPPHIGGAQPLEGKKLTPPAGPVPQNPPFNGGSRINPAILGCWAAVAIAAAVLPTLPRNLTPPSAPAIVRPVPNTALQNILAAWTPPPWVPVVAINLDPPLAGPGFSLVIFDAKSSSSTTGLGLQTFTDSTKLTVANNPNRALILTINLGGSPSGFTASWDGVAMTQLGLLTQSTFDDTTVMFGLRNPSPGTKPLTASWSGTADFVANAASFYNVDQTSDALAFANVTTAQGTTSPASVTVTSVPGDMVLATHTLGAFVTQFTTVSGAQHYSDKNNAMAGAAARSGASASTSTTMTAVESAAAPWTSIGVDIKPARVPPARWPQEATMAAWVPPYQPPIVGPKLPPQQVAAASFPFRGSSVPTEVLAAWTPAPFFQVMQRLLVPPISGPVANNPPFMGGAAVPQAVLSAWIPPSPAPIMAVNLDPPIQGPVAQNPPFAGGAAVPQTVLNAWIPPAPAPIVAANLCPPIAGPLASNPPFNGGAAVPLAVQIAWLPAPPAPIVAQNLTPPSAPVVTFTPALRFPAEILASWQVTPPAAIVAQKLTPPSAPVTVVTPPTRFPTEILNSWQVAPFAIITAQNLTPPSGPVTAVAPPIGSRVPLEVLLAWASVPWSPIVGPKLPPQPAALNLWTPSNLTTVTLEGWYRVHDPAAILADGSDLTLISTVAQTWADRSGHGRTISKEGSPGYDANGLSTGHPAATFAFAGFRTAAGAGYPTGAVIGSMAIGTTTTDGRITSLNASAATDFGVSGFIPLIQGGGNLTYWYNSNTANTTHANGATVAIFEGVPLSTTTADVGINTVLSGTPVAVTGVTLDRMGLFAESDSGGSNPSGTCAENILWAGVISISELQKLEGYIAWNNGQQALLPGGHPYAGGPPLLGPTVNNPPFVGSQIPQAVLNAWIPPASAPIVAQNLTPPSGPIGITPPARFPTEILNSWQVITPAAIVARNLTPPSGPVTTFPPLGSFVPREVLISWIPPAPMPIVARNLVPPISGPVPDNPPFIGALVPISLPDDWTPIVARNLTPPTPAVITFTPPARFPSEILNAWQVAAPVAIVAQNLTPPSGPAPYVPIGSRVPVEILNAWILPVPMPVLAINLNPPISAPPNLPVGGGARVPGEVLINWLPPAPMPVLARNLTPPSGPVADNPPFNGGASLKLEIQLNWQAAQPGYPPLKAINTTPPSGPPPIVSAEIHAKPFFVSFGLRPL